MYTSLAEAQIKQEDEHVDRPFSKVCWNALKITDKSVIGRKFTFEGLFNSNLFSKIMYDTI